MQKSVIAKLLPFVLLAVWFLILALGLLQYVLPAGYLPRWGANAPGVAQFRAVWGIDWQPLQASAYVPWFEGLWGAAVIAYAAVLLLAHRARVTISPAVVVAAWVFVLAYATLVPAGMSCDVYAYVAYARMALVHGLNPHLHTQLELAALHDPVVPFLQWNVPTPYGPLWTLTSMAAIAPFQSASVLLQVLALKWLAGISLLLLAREISRLAERLSPGRGGLAYLAIVASPLLIFEGAGNGHNDFFLAMLLAVGLRLWFEHRFNRAALLLGLSAAVKFVPLLLLPWLLWIRRRQPDGGWRKLAGLVALMLLPLVGLSLFFAFDGLPAKGLAVHVAQVSNGRHWVAVALLAFYAGFVLWIVRQTPRYWVTAWPALSLALIVLIGPPYPWYFVWPVSVALVRWDRIGMALSFICILLGHWVMLGYALPHPNWQAAAF